MALAVSDEIRVEQTEAIIDDLAKKIGAEPITADVILSEVDNSTSKKSTKVVRSVGKK